jgi:hypothetical protein
MRILVLNADYPRFLAWFYRRQAELESASYATQPACLASPISIRKLRRVGHPAAEIHVNNPWLQAAWAREHGMAFEAPESRRYRPQGASSHVCIGADRPIRRLRQPRSSVGQRIGRLVLAVTG